MLLVYIKTDGSDIFLRINVHFRLNYIIFAVVVLLPDFFDSLPDDWKTILYRYVEISGGSPIVV